MLVMFSAIIAEAFKVIVTYNFGDPLDYEPFNVWKCVEEK